MGIGQKTHVKNKIGIHRQAVLETEGHHTDAHGTVTLVTGYQIDNLAAELCRGQNRGIDDSVGPVADGFQQGTLPLHRVPQG